MVAVIKDMFFPHFAKDVKEVSKAAAKPEVKAKDERTALIDRMVDSLGLDWEARRRYFELTRVV